MERTVASPSFENTAKGGQRERGRESLGDSIDGTVVVARRSSDPQPSRPGFLKRHRYARIKDGPRVSTRECKKLELRPVASFSCGPQHA
jgi:hypothetical protein